MRVLIVSKAFVVAAYRRKLAELARLGIEVVAVSPPAWREAGAETRIEPGRDESFRMEIAPMRWNGRFHLHYYPTLPAIIRAEKPDLVHLDEEPYNVATFAGTLACRRLGIPSVFFTWQNLLRRYPLPFRDLERAVYRWSAGAIAGTQEAAEVLGAKGYRGPLAVIPQFGVDPNLFYPATTPPSGPLRVGFLNRLTPGKAPLLTLHAFAALGGDTFLEIVGDGPLGPEVESEIRRLGLENRVRLRPRLPSTEVPNLLRSLHVLVLPSLTMPNWKEQFGRVLVEAMACGIPVVGSDSGEIPRVIGDAGLVVPEGSTATLRDALIRLRDDAGLRAELGQRGRRRALDHFTHAAVAAQTLALYQKVLAGHGASPSPSKSRGPAAMDAQART